jgi:hypothetical protein
MNEGIVPVKLSNGTIKFISKDDPRYISGELKYMFSDMVFVKDNDGNTMQV